MKKTRILGLAALFFFVAGTATTDAYGEDTSEKIYDAGKTAPTGDLIGPPLALNLEDFLQLVREKSEQIAIQASELAISREAVKGKHSIFEPAFVGSYQYQNDAHRNTVQEKESLGRIDDFHERTMTYQAAVEALASTGASLRVGYTQRDFSNNLQDQFDLTKESQTIFGVAMTQPLLKGRGAGPTMAGIRTAERDADIALQAYREQMMRTIADAIKAYWDFSLAWDKYRMRKESEHNAETILRDNVIRVKTGKMAETDVQEARAAVAMRRALVSGARQAIVASMNVVRSFFSSSAADGKIEIQPTQRLEVHVGELDFSKSLASALQLRPQYLSSRKKIEREEISVVFAENQVLPKLDLKASYNMNGLSDSVQPSLSDAFGRDYETWSVGLELRIPLGGDKKNRAELEATREKKRQALLELKAAEVAVKNDVDTAIQGVLNARRQIDDMGNVVEMTRQLLNAESVKFAAGKSSSRSLLDREEDLNKAQEAEIESLVKFQYSLTQLRLAERSILTHYGIDPGQNGSK